MKNINKNYLTNGLIGIVPIVIIVYFGCLLAFPNGFPKHPKDQSPPLSSLSPEQKGALVSAAIEKVDKPITQKDAAAIKKVISAPSKPSAPQEITPDQREALSKILSQ